VGGYLDRAGVRALLATAALFVHTSPVEGFPNAVLEAWASGVPSIAAVDPDGIVAREGIGATIADLPGLVREVERWMADPESRRTSGARARAYVAREHAPGPTLDRLAAVLERAASARRSASA
jgi:glycosyltransferase involved in cell wall biosynthesis